MKNFIILSFVSTLFLFPSCVSQKKYQEMEMSRNHFQDEYESLRTVKGEKDKLSEEVKFMESQLRQSLQELEQTTVKAKRLDDENTDLLKRYETLLEQNKSILSNTSFEKQDLEEQLALKVEELDQKERELSALEYTLNEREGSVESLMDNLTDREARISELETLLSAKDEQMDQLKSSINNALRGFKAADLTVSERNGKIYVSLSQNLLFKSGSDKIDWKGRNAIQQIGEVLAQQSDIDITVEGHTDNKGSADLNWDLSAKRATSVVKELTKAGVDPERLTAAGRGLYAPLVTNDTEANRAKNRRTEIVLSPQLDQLYDIIGN